jgi:tetratricopeptide (TPR) repeat protein
MKQPSAGEEDDRLWSRLPQQVADHFNFSELNLLCFELNVNPQSLGQNMAIEAYALALISYMKQRGRLPELIAAFRRERPHVVWPDAPEEVDDAAPSKTIPDERPQPKPEPTSIEGWQKRAGIIAVIALLVGVTAVLILQNRRTQPTIEPMGVGFNIAVASFSTVQDSDTARDAAQQLSDWLYESVVSDVENASTSLAQFDYRGPDQIGIITGDDSIARYQYAKQVAYDHQATILIYGVVEEKLPHYQVALEFFVNDESFDYGSEIAGPDSLGTPITFTLPLDLPTAADVNEQINGRRDALQHVVRGLSHFQLEEFNLAVSEFQWVVDDDGWAKEDGKEVIHLLLGATHLRLYDPLTAPMPLQQAEAHFVQARELNPEYRRNYLGLGAVAFAKAQIIDPTIPGIVAVDPIRLKEAEGLFITSMQPSFGLVHPYVEFKANLGLGAVQLLGYEFDLDGYSDSDVERYFDAVLTDFEIAGEPDSLAWFAANAHAELGILASVKQDWEQMIAANRDAIDILDDLDRPPAVWIARYNARIGDAYTAQNNSSKAIEAYQEAIEVGGTKISDVEFKEWSERIEALTESP